MPRPAYFVFDSTILNFDGMKPYLAEVDATVAAFGGERLVLGGRLFPVEGTAPKGVFVVLRFPDLATANAWYESPAYRAILGHRLAAAQTDAWVVEGWAPAAE